MTQIWLLVIVIYGGDGLTSMAQTHIRGTRATCETEGKRALRDLDPGGYRTIKFTCIETGEREIRW